VDKDSREATVFICFSLRMIVNSTCFLCLIVAFDLIAGGAAFGQGQQGGEACG
jgi:hypothetical protein